MPQCLFDGKQREFARVVVDVRIAFRLDQKCQPFDPPRVQTRKLGGEVARVAGICGIVRKNLHSHRLFL
jgi:hypothetical protein